MASKNDWRLPSLLELIFIVDYSQYYPSINSIFIGTNNSSYWSSYVVNEVIAVVNFGNGTAPNNYNNSSTAYARCVRGQVKISSSFLDNGDNTVTDSISGLIWQQDETSTKNWENALIYSEI